MKIHLPVSLRKALLTVCALCAATTADAAFLHPDVTYITFTDFGQNRGRYTVGNTNALTNYIRQRDGGVVISYKNDKYEPYTMPHDMIDFSSADDISIGAAIGYNGYVTVEHNVHALRNTFTGNYIGSENAIIYQSIEIVYSMGSANNIKTFLLTPSNDHKLSRQSKLITDVTPSTVYGSVDHDWSGLYSGSFAGQFVYRSGSGGMKVPQFSYYIATAYTYVTGAMFKLSGNSGAAVDGTFGCNVVFNCNRDVNTNNPLPFVAMPGDSGSPAWIWNERTGQYEFLTNLFAGDLVQGSYFNGAPQWDTETLESFNININAGAQVHIGAVTETDGTVLSDNLGNVACPVKGTVTDGNGGSHKFVGVGSGLNTWSDLTELKDTGNWYSYSEKYLNSAVTYPELFGTQNLVFKATQEQTSIVVDADVDLGIGYVQLNRGELEHASFTITGGMLNSAGYVVNDGVDLHLQLTNSANYLREWRAVVESGATLHIEGSGDNYALLNLGGQGTTYLERNGGYAAYNVLANNGTTVVIQDLGQIKRDFTFGFRGGVLDMNGLSMAWNNDNGADAPGFTIHALDEQAVVANLKAGTTTTLTWTQGGGQTWLGSFQDTADSALKFIYNGGGVLAMNSIHTHLQNAGSGLEVRSGTLKLAGTNTVHGMGSAAGNSSIRYSNNLDWHYADVTANVEVKNGGTFELESHARLIGNVTVAEGGTFVMHEGTQHQMEYIEGAQMLEDTYDIREFYGLKGNVDNNGAMVVRYSAGTDSHNVYVGNISGTGSFTADLGIKGRLELTGGFSISGAKAVSSGMVIIGGDSVGSGAKWTIAEQGVLAISQADAAATLALVDASSHGVLALGQNVAAQLDMSGHGDLFLGAQTGTTVQYGTAGTAETLEAWHTANGRSQWLLGGGEGTLVVNWKLSGNNDLVLGNAYGNGTVYLANESNDFTGNIIFTPGSNIILNYTTEAALGGGRVNLTYGMALSGGSHVDGMVNSAAIDAAAKGIILVDGQTDAAIDMSARRNLALGADGADVEFTGSIAVAENQAYRLGGPGNLTVASVLAANGNNDLIVDAQGFSGGSVKLTARNTLTGGVEVVGYDLAQNDINSGDISLVLGADHALDAAASVTVERGGTLVAAEGTTQHLQNLYVSNGGEAVAQASSNLQVEELSVVSGGILSGTGTVETLGGSITGNLNVSTLSKTGNGTLTIANGGNGALNFGTIAVQQGTLAIESNLLGGSGTVAVSDGANVSFTNSNLQMDKVLKAADGIGTVNVNNTCFTKNLDAEAGATLALNGSNAVLDNNIYVGKGSVAESRALHLASSGGTVDFSGVDNLTVNAWDSNVATLVVDGTMHMAKTTTIQAYEYYTPTVKVNRMEVAGASTINQTWAADSATKLNVQSLTGSGSLTWNVQNDCETSSVLSLSSAGDFDGELTVRHIGYSANYGTFQTYLALNHRDAAQNATVNLEGGNGAVSLALNADHVKVGGLNGGANSNVFAGEAPSTSSASPEVSSRNAVLEITGSGNNTYSGTIAGSDTDEAQVSIVMSGSGTQTFNGGALLRDVTVNRGTLNLDGYSVAVSGNYSVAQGATFGSDTGLLLGNGQTLFATAGTAGACANINGGLIISGGTISFSGNALAGMGDNYLLNINGSVEGADSLHVTLTETAALSAGTYRLATGNFSGVNTDNISFQHDYYDASFSSNASGLSLTLVAKAGHLVWDGTDSAHTLSASTFGQQSASVTGKTIVFTDTARNQNIVVSDWNSASAAIFDTDEGYTISGNGTIGVDTLTKDGIGDLNVLRGLNIWSKTNLNAGRLILHGQYIMGDIDGEDATLAFVGFNASDLASTLNGTVGTLEIGNGATFSLDVDKKDDKDGNSGGLTVARKISVQNGGVLIAGSEPIEAIISLEGGEIQGSGTVETKLAVSGNSSVNIASGSLMFTDVTSSAGSTLTKKGAGTLSIESTSVSLNTLAVQAGGVNIASYLTTNKIREISLASGATLTQGTASTLTTALTLAGGSSVNLEYGYNSTTRLNSAISVNGNATMGFTRYGNGGTAQVTGTITGNGKLSLAYQKKDSWAAGSALAVTLTSSISDAEGGSLALDVASGMIVNLTGTNTYSGGTTITNGELKAANVQALGTGAVAIGSNGTLTLGSELIIQHGLSGSGTLQSDGSYHVLGITTVEGETHTYSGALTNKNVGIVVGGNGTQVFSGAVAMERELRMGENATVDLRNGGSLRSTTIEGNGTLSINGAALVAVKASGMDMEDSATTLTGLDSTEAAPTSATFTKEGISGAEIVHANIAVKENFNLSSVTFTDSDIDVAADKTLGVSHVLLGQDSAITLQQGASLNAKDLTIGSDNEAEMTVSGRTPAVGEDYTAATIRSHANGTELNVTSTWLTFSDSDIEVKTTADTTAAARLENSKLTVTGGGRVAVQTTAGTTNDFDAQTGDVLVQTATTTIGTLDVSEGRSLTVNNGNGTAVVTGKATVAGAVNADVVVQAAAGSSARAEFVANTGSLVDGNMTVTNTGSLVIGSAEGFSVDGNLNLQDGSSLTATMVDVSGGKDGDVFLLATSSGTITFGSVLLNYSGTLAEGLTASLQIMPISLSAGLGSPTSQLVLKLSAGTPSTLDTVVTGAVGFDGNVLTLATELELNKLTSPLTATLAVGAWESIMATVGDTNQWVSIALTDVHGSAIDLDGQALAINGYAGVGGKYFVAHIPEPATATLSLLALAALAARRRRK